jgi:formylglycine-generating enzyme required for sulfatase activity
MTKHSLSIGLQFFVVFLLSNHFKESARAQESIAIPSVKSDTPSSSVTNSIGMKLVPIPAGRFTMGSPASERGSQEDEVLHKVELTRSFHMGATEVTEHQWAMVMEESFRTEIVEVRDPDTKRLIKKEERQIKNPKLDSQLPIANISWSQATEYCKRLGQLPEEKKEGRNYRLPTEAEWEYACRAGSSTAYSFGDDATRLNDCAWQQGNGGKLMPVATKKQNPWGLFDMHGNVFEWVHDYYGAYPDVLVTDPVGPSRITSLARVIRGGSSQSRPFDVRSGFRAKLFETGKLVGLRLVLAAPLHNYVANSIGQNLIEVPGGEFVMGGKEADNGPPHNVGISRAFLIAATETTQRQWKSVMGDEPWKGKMDVVEGDDYAASYISWDAAVEFCQRLSARPEERAAGRAYRLPTEAEWEYACRAGTGTDFCFGDDKDLLDDFAFHAEMPKIQLSVKEHLTNSGWEVVSKKETVLPRIASPQVVAQKEPNFWGLYDVHGNVSEWCSDRRGSYPTGVVTDPTGPADGTHHVYRGGSWKSSSRACQSAHREGSWPGYQSSTLGLRVVADR